VALVPQVNILGQLMLPNEATWHSACGV